jgi:hypothetical protein
MQIEILHPVSHGVGKGRSIEYGRGIYHTDNPKAKAYLPPDLAEEFLKLSDSHSGEPIVRLYRQPQAAAPAEGKAQVTERKR